MAGFVARGPFTSNINKIRNALREILDDKKFVKRFEANLYSNRNKVFYQLDIYVDEPEYMMYLLVEESLENCIRKELSWAYMEHQIKIKIIS